MRIGAMLDYAGSQNPSKQLKFGSCCIDLLSARPYGRQHYNPESFDHERIVKGDLFGIVLENDVIGGLIPSSWLLA